MANTNVKMVELANRAVAENWEVEELMSQMYEIGCEDVYLEDDGIEFADSEENHVAFEFNEEDEVCCILFNDSMRDFHERVHNLFT